MADSLETQAIVRYLQDSGVPHIRSSYYCTGHSPNGYHCLPGTDGRGTAVDFQDPYPRDKPSLLAIFNTFDKVRPQLAELIYSGADYSIKNGVRVARYAVSNHWDHVHVAVRAGTLIRWAATPTPLPPPATDPVVPEGVVVVNSPLVAVLSHPNGGYLEVCADGGVFAFGDAPFFGSEGATPLNKPIVGAALTKTGNGYWLVASDGGVFTHGDARFYGGLGDVALNKPIIGMSPTASGQGYRLYASDGGVFNFGDAGFYGTVQHRG